MYQIDFNHPSSIYFVGIGRNLQKEREREDNYVKNEYKNRKKAKKSSNKYSLSPVNVL